MALFYLTQLITTFILEAMNQQTTNSIDTIMYQGAKIEVTLITNETLSGSFNGFLPTKDATFIVVVSTDLESTHNTLIPMNNVLHLNFPQKLSTLIK